MGFSCFLERRGERETLEVVLSSAPAGFVQSGLGSLFFCCQLPGAANANPGSLNVSRVKLARMDFEVILCSWRDNNSCYVCVCVRVCRMELKVTVWSLPPLPVSAKRVRLRNSLLGKVQGKDEEKAAELTVTEWFVAFP